MLRYTILALFALLFSSNTFADPLQDALAIVIAKSESVQGKQRVLGLTNKSSNLNSSIKLSSGYSDKQNDEFAPGFQNRAQITFEYPLMGATTQTDKEKAQALSSLYETKDNLIRSFILELQKLALLKADMDSANRIHNLTIDLLKRAKMNNDTAVKTAHFQDQINIAPLLDKAISAENAARKAVTNFRTMLEATCRIYGKDEWKILRTHTIAYLKTMGSGTF